MYKPYKGEQTITFRLYPDLFMYLFIYVKIFL